MSTEPLRSKWRPRNLTARESESSVSLSVSFFFLLSRVAQEETEGERKRERKKELPEEEVEEKEEEDAVEMCKQVTKKELCVFFVCQDESRGRERGKEERETGRRRSTCVYLADVGEVCISASFFLLLFSLLCLHTWTEKTLWIGKPDSGRRKLRETPSVISHAAVWTCLRICVLRRDLHRKRYGVMDYRPTGKKKEEEKKKKKARLTCGNGERRENRAGEFSSVEKFLQFGSSTGLFSSFLSQLCSCMYSRSETRRGRG